MKIILNNGLEYLITWCGIADGIFHVELKGDNTIPAIADVFSDAGATSEIKYIYGTDSQRYYGYTDLLGVKKDRHNGFITVTLQYMEG